MPRKRKTHPCQQVDPSEKQDFSSIAVQTAPNDYNETLPKSENCVNTNFAKFENFPPVHRLVGNLGDLGCEKTGGNAIIP